MIRVRTALLVPSAAVLLALAAGPALAAASTAAVWHMDETTGTTMRDASGHGQQRDAQAHRARRTRDQRLQGATGSTASRR